MFFLGFYFSRILLQDPPPNSYHFIFHSFIYFILFLLQLYIIPRLVKTMAGNHRCFMWLANVDFCTTSGISNLSSNKGRMNRKWLLLSDRFRDFPINTHTSPEDTKKFESLTKIVMTTWSNFFTIHIKVCSSTGVALTLALVKSKSEKGESPAEDI